MVNGLIIKRKILKSNPFLSDFPDSKPAIDDLKICLDKIDLRVYLVKSLKDVLEKRLLHPGVNTRKFRFRMPHQSTEDNFSTINSLKYPQATF